MSLWRISQFDCKETIRVHLHEKVKPVWNFKSVWLLVKHLISCSVYIRVSPQFETCVVVVHFQFKIVPSMKALRNCLIVMLRTAVKKFSSNLPYVIAKNFLDSYGHLVYRVLFAPSITIGQYELWSRDYGISTIWKWFAFTWCFQTRATFQTLLNKRVELKSVHVKNEQF